MIIMEWYAILSLVLSVLITLITIFVANKTRVITNFKTLTDKVWNEEDIKAIADLFNITIESLIKVLAIFGIVLDIPDLPDIPDDV